MSEAMEAVLDSPEVIDEPIDDVVDEPAEQVDEPVETQIEDKIDGRKFNPKWSQDLKALREAHPEYSEMLTKMRDDAGRMLALKELAGNGLEDVRNWKTTIDALGGAEAAADLMSRASQMEAFDERVINMDAAVIDDLPEEMQKGIYGMLPDLLGRMEQNDPQGYAAALQPKFAAALAGTGMGEHLKQMYELAEGNAPLQAEIKKQFDWFTGQTNGAARLPNNGGVKTPEMQRFERERETFQQQRDEAFLSSVTQPSVQYQAETFTKLMSPYKNLNLTEAQQDDLKDSFNAKLVSKMEGDTAFQKQLAAYKGMKNRDAATVTSYIQANIDKHAKTIMDGLVTARYGKRTASRPAVATATPTTNNGAVRVAQVPSQDQWDMAKMEDAGYENTAKKGIYYLKGNKTVQLVRQ